MDNPKLHPFYFSFPRNVGKRTRSGCHFTEIARRIRRYYTRNPIERKRRSPNRFLMIEDLEDREMLSAISPVAANVQESDTLMASTAVYAPASVSPASTATVEIVQHGTTPAAPAAAEKSLTATPPQASMVDAVFASDAATQATRASWFQNPSLIDLSDMPGGGGIPADYRPPIPGIPGTDTGGVAGYNGGGRLPLEIPGFQGYGNAYYLDINDETLPRTVWLYAQYFRNQPRVTPGQTWLVRPDIDYSWANYYFDGVRISTSVYSMITDQALEELKQEKIEDVMKQEALEEIPIVPHENLKEKEMEKHIPKTLREVPEKPELPETDTPRENAPSALPPEETDTVSPNPVEVPHPHGTPAYPIPQPESPTMPPVVDPPSSHPIRSTERLEE